MKSKEIENGRKTGNEVKYVESEGKPNFAIPNKRQKWNFLSLDFNNCKIWLIDFGNEKTKNRMFLEF